MTATRSDPIFWEVGGYKANIKRIKDGSDHLDEFSKMIKERAEIEQKYGKALQAWQSKWLTYVDQTLSDSVIKSLWSDLMDESKELAKVHLQIRERCQDELLKTIQLFRKENYHQSTIRGFREAKEIDEEFEKAQRPWKKLFEKMESCKKAYYTACRTEKSTAIQLVNLKGDASTANESTDKLKERLTRCEEEVNKTRTAYKNALTELSGYSAVYNENMAFVFEKCQLMEVKRARFLLEMLSGFQQILIDLLNPPRLVQVHDNLANRFTSTGENRIKEDLQKWSALFGVASPLIVPTYEEYTPEMRQITSNGTGKGSEGRDESGGVILMKQKITSDELPGTPTIAHSLERQSALQKYPENRRSTLSQQISQTSHVQKKLRKDLNESPKMARANSTDTQVNMRESEGSSIRSFHASRSLDCSSADRYSLSRKSESIEEEITILDRTLTKSSSPCYDKQEENQEIESRHVVENPFADPFPMPTPNRALMQASGDAFSPIKRHQKNGLGASLTSMLALEKKQTDNTQDIINNAYQRPSPRAQSDSGNSNGSNESENQQMPRGPAKVLYDYCPIEDDEIPLAKGEVLEVLHGPDDLGWCYGRKGVLQGLFPASYVSPM
ncbi:unnamed protein product [Bursaphelenchus xylophilus]|uniref:(pine wood nematode) hypothetical protein n=1 Tax=Bursaphelenchus xylophilus TaxID=6326 RepID=A0A1I7RR14_BURXY|nr:unnamed protein product [Bursaphelenchus xylophilus]CAG9130798.1 unnamed protein product [Bursaphelenchus xylophilus]